MTAPNSTAAELQADLPAYLTPEQLAAALNVSPKTIYRWAKEPTMPVLRRGKVLRFPRERIFVWLRDQEQGVPRHRRSQKQMLGAPQRRESTTIPSPPPGSCAAPCAAEGSGR